ncbi:MAG: leucine-rich repeat protein [Treponematales bacterium]
MLKEVTLPEGLINIGSYAFYGCASLRSVNFPSTLKKIGDSVFWSSGIESVEFNEGLEEIGDFVFSNGSSSGNNLKSVKFPSTLRSIGSAAFCGTKLTEVDLSATRVSELGAFVFRYCAKLESVKLPKSLTLIDTYAFAECSSLKTLDFSETSISVFEKTSSRWCFKGCSALETLIFPASLTRLGVDDESPYASMIFQTTPLMKSIVVKAVKPPRLVVYVGGNDIPVESKLAFKGTHADFAVYVPDASVATYQEAANWSACIIKPLSAWAGK